MTAPAECMGAKGNVAVKLRRLLDLGVPLEAPIADVTVLHEGDCAEMHRRSVATPEPCTCEAEVWWRGERIDHLVNTENGRTRLAWLAGRPLNYGLEAMKERNG